MRHVLPSDGMLSEYVSGGHHDEEPQAQHGGGLHDNLSSLLLHTTSHGSECGCSYPKRPYTAASKTGDYALTHPLNHVTIL